jgi:hypothetical protein
MLSFIEKEIYELAAFKIPNQLVFLVGRWLGGMKLSESPAEFSTAPSWGIVTARFKSSHIKLCIAMHL